MCDLGEVGFTTSINGSCHVFQFPFIPLIATSHIMNLILAVPCNIYILWQMTSKPNAVTALEFFTLNLAVSEILFGLSNVCFLVAYFQGIFSLLSVTVFCSTFLYTGRPLFETCICVERYLAVVHPVLFLRLRSLRSRLLCCGLVWLLVLASGFLNQYIKIDVMQQCSIFLYILLFSVNLFCCLSVLRALKRPGPGEREGNSEVKVKAFKVILIITMFMILTYSPYILALILKMHVSSWKFNEVYMICTSITLGTGFVHPLLFLHRTGKLPCLAF